MPRPAGRSGWVSTSTHLVAGGKQGLEGRRRKLRRAGEDQLHRRSKRFARPLLQLALDAFALEAGEVFDEDLAFEVVHLVLDADRQQVVGRISKGLPSSPSARTRTWLARVTVS
jgi:hypothetical protein